MCFKSNWPYYWLLIKHPPLSAWFYIFIWRVFYGFLNKRSTFYAGKCLGSRECTPSQMSSKPIAISLKRERAPS